MKAFKGTALAILALGLLSTSGCDQALEKEIFYMVAANQALPYWQTAAAGFNKAAAQYKVTAKVVGPDNYDPQAELADLQKAVAAKPEAFPSQLPTSPCCSQRSTPPSMPAFR